jgi:hypothetical protein
MDTVVFWINSRNQFCPRRQRGGFSRMVSTSAGQRSEFDERGVARTMQYAVSRHGVKSSEGSAFEQPSP